MSEPVSATRMMDGIIGKISFPLFGLERGYTCHVVQMLESC